MRVSVFVGVSLDGFLARKNGKYDFLPEEGGDDNGYGEFVATVDAHVIGRNTFDTVLGFAEWPFGRKLVVILSRTPARVRVPKGVNCEVMTATPKHVVARLARRGVKHIYVDGGRTIQSFLKANLVDRLIINRYPVLIGNGIPLFGALPHDIRLRHVKTQSFPRGLVKSEYRVLPR
jgi:dihydrofolate reductase